MTGLREQLEQQVAQAPDDWSLWLVYADWLTEQGDVRGQMITLGHELATKSLPRAAARKLERQLMELEGRKTWRRALPSWEHVERVTFRHGFVLEATFRLDDAGRHFRDLCDAGEAWLLQRLTFEATDPMDLRGLASSGTVDGFVTEGATATPAREAAARAAARLHQMPYRQRHEQRSRDEVRFVLRRSALPSGGAR